MILEVLWHSIDTFPKENIMHSLKQMTLNLPKWPWVKMMTHIQIFCNLWQIVWSENSPSFYSLDTNNALFLQVTLNLSKWPWVKVLSHLGLQQFLCDIEIPNHHVTPKEIYGSDTFYLSDLELVHMTLGQGHNTTLFPTNIIIGGKKIFS